jgi:hypothetical protein
MLDSRGRYGYAHNAQAMEIALFEPLGNIRYLVPDLVAKAPTGRPG